jgi:hypothetical protein
MATPAITSNIATLDQIAIRFITTSPFLLAIQFEHRPAEHAIKID